MLIVDNNYNTIDNKSDIPKWCVQDEGYVIISTSEGKKRYVSSGNWSDDSGYSIEPAKSFSEAKLYTDVYHAKKDIERLEEYGFDKSKAIICKVILQKVI